MAEQAVSKKELQAWSQLIRLHELAIQDIEDGQQRLRELNAGLEHFFNAKRGESLLFKGRAALVYFNGNSQPQFQADGLEIPASYYTVSGVTRQHEVNRQHLPMVRLQPDGDPNIEAYVAYLHEVAPAKLAEIAVAHSEASE